MTIAAFFCCVTIVAVFTACTEDDNAVSTGSADIVGRVIESKITEVDLSVRIAWYVAGDACEVVVGGSVVQTGGDTVVGT